MRNFSRSILKHSINAWDRICERMFRPIECNSIPMSEEQIGKLWDDTIESQYDCEWGELSQDGRDQVIRFVNLIIEITQ